MRIGILASHPIQYQAPWFRELARHVDLHVFYAHQESKEQQGEAGFGRAFEWDVDLLSGYRYTFLFNVAKHPNVNRWAGCVTPEIVDYIRLGQFDAFIVTGWFLRSYWQAIRACKRTKVPVLVRGDSQLHTPRSLVKRIGKQLFYRVLLRQIDGFLVVGQRFREYLLHYGVEPQRMFSVPHFVDSKQFAEAAATFRCRFPSCDARTQVCIVLFVGKFIWQKRPADLLKAIAKTRTPNGFVAVFVGDGPLAEQLREQATTLGINARFEGFQNQSQLPKYYGGADVLVLPSESETWGLVVNEAMACGIPAIVSDAVGCAPDLIENGVTGFTYPVANTEALAERLERVRAAWLAGHDWTGALKQKIERYSLDAAVIGTLKAVAAMQ